MMTTTTIMSTARDIQRVNITVVPSPTPAVTTMLIGVSRPTISKKKFDTLSDNRIRSFSSSIDHFYIIWWLDVTHLHLLYHHHTLFTVFAHEPASGVDLLDFYLCSHGLQPAHKLIVACSSPGLVSPFCWRTHSDLHSDLYCDLTSGRYRVVQEP